MFVPSCILKIPLDLYGAQGRDCIECVDCERCGEYGQTHQRRFAYITTNEPEMLFGRVKQPKR